MSIELAGDSVLRNDSDPQKKEEGRAIGRSLRERTLVILLKLFFEEQAFAVEEANRDAHNEEYAGYEEQESRGSPGRRWEIG